MNPLSGRLTRRTFLRSTVALSLAGAVGCSSRRNAVEELRVFCYAGGHERQMREVFVPLFEQQTGAVLSLYPGWWDGVPKLKAAPENNPPFDLMVTDATQGYPAAREGLFAALDFSRIPNHRRLAPSTLDNWIFRERHGLPYPDSVMTLAYHRQRVQREPSRWADLLHDDLSGRIGLYNAFYLSLYTFAAILADQNGQPGTAHELIRTRLDEVLRFARQNRERVKLWWPTSNDMILSLVNGECTAGNMHSPEYLTALREKSELGAVVPEADRAFVQVFWAIPAGSRHQELAHRALDLLFSDEVQLGFARLGSATALLPVAQQMAAEDPFWKQLYPHTEEQFRHLRYYPYEIYAEHWDRLADEWDRTVLRPG